ncbi:MAG: carbohydrate-binding domain-containing protein [Eubacteriales bacterium]
MTPSENVAVLPASVAYVTAPASVSAEQDVDLDAFTESAVTLTAAGTYRVHGTLDGMILIDASKTDEITLILDGASVVSSMPAAIYVRKAGVVRVTLAEGSVNTLAGSGEAVRMDESNLDAVIFSKSDLIFDGTGALTVTSDACHGIVGKDSLNITGGTYDITAAGHGISAKDSLDVSGGTFTIAAGKDGIHAENSDNADLGSISIGNGTFTITSEGDGISASGWLQIDDICAAITAGGGPENASAHAGDQMMGGGRGFFGGMSWNSPEASSEDETGDTASTSFKAIKSGGDMLLTGGTYTLSSAEDTLHTNANLTIDGGTYMLAAGDDGIHADLALVINGGEVTVTESYEGIEAQTIDINDGIVTVKSSDDGFNASGGTASGGEWSRNMMAAEDGVSLTFRGGQIFVDAEGDGLDSNGVLTVLGGEIYVAGPTSSGNGALDYGSSAAVSGGTLIAVGADGMAASFGSSSTQGSMMVSVGNQPAGSTVTLTDASGNVLAEYTFAKSFSNVVVTCPGLVDGGTYTLTAGTYSETITMNGLLYSGMGGMGGMFGGRGGMEAGGKDRGQKQDMIPEEFGESPEAFDGGPGAFGGDSEGFRKGMDAFAGNP